MAWADQPSNRSKDVPGNWKTLRKTVKARTNGLCVKCGQPGNQCDHIDPNGGHALTNLQWLCARCHYLKTQSESQAGQQARISRRTKQVEKHPGLKW